MDLACQRAQRGGVCQGPPKGPVRRRPQRAKLHTHHQSCTGNTPWDTRLRHSAHLADCRSTGAYWRTQYTILAPQARAIRRILSSVADSYHRWRPTLASQTQLSARPYAPTSVRSTRCLPEAQHGHPQNAIQRRRHNHHPRAIQLRQLLPHRASCIHADTSVRSTPSSLTGNTCSPAYAVHDPSVADNGRLQVTIIAGGPTSRMRCNTWLTLPTAGHDPSAAGLHTWQP